MTWEPIERPWVWFGSTDRDDVDDVAVLQRRLREVGPVDPCSGRMVDPSGTFGRATDQAVRAFQRECGLDETGICDEKVWLHLS